MFSFVGDTVLDPFLGTGTTTVGAAKWGRNSIGYEVDRHYYKLAEKRVSEETSSLFSTATIHSPSADFDKELRRAIRHFWSTRKSQAQKQGSKSGSRDAGARTAVTGGRQMDGFVDLVREHLSANGIPKTQVFCRKSVELPGGIAPRSNGTC